MTKTPNPSVAQYAFSVSEEAAKVGFDWESPDDVLDKLGEELSEVKQALHQPLYPGHLEEEIGDLFFALVNFNRKTHVDSDRAFLNGVLKFERRFNLLKKFAAQQNRDLNSLSPEEFDALWNRVKRELQSSHS